MILAVILSMLLLNIVLFNALFVFNIFVVQIGNCEMAHSLFASSNSATPRTLICIMSIIVLNQLSNNLRIVPKVHLFESRICQAYYHAHQPQLWPAATDRRIDI